MFDRESYEKWAERRKLKDVTVKKHLAERFMDWAIGDRTFKFSFPLKFASEVFHEIRDWFEDQPEYRIVPEPSWTTQKPEHHGFYWYWDPDDPSGFYTEPTIVMVWWPFTKPELCMADSASGDTFKDATAPGRWYGPLVPPGDTR